MLEDLKPPVNQSRNCKVSLVSESLTDADKKILQDAIADANSWPIKTLSKALKAKGVEISDTPLTNHRAKTCACFRMN